MLLQTRLKLGCGSSKFVYPVRAINHMSFDRIGGADEPVLLLPR